MQHRLATWKLAWSSVHGIENLLVRCAMIYPPEMGLRAEALIRSRPRLRTVSSSKLMLARLGSRAAKRPPLDAQKPRAGLPLTGGDALPHFNPAMVQIALQFGNRI